MKFSLNKLLLGMLLPFLNMQMGIVEGEGGGADDGDDGDDDAEAAKLAQKALDDAEAAKGDKGKTGISDSEAKLLKDVMAKKTALKEANDNLSKLNEQLKAFEGIDPVAVRALLKQQDDAETSKLEAQGQWDKLKSQMAETHKAEMGGVQSKVSALELTLQEQSTVISELTVGNAFSTSEFIKEELLLTPNKTRAAYGNNFSYEDGTIVGYDKPKGVTGRTVLVDSSGDPLSFEEALKKIVDMDSDRDQILRSKVKQGSGSKSTTPKAKVVDTGAGDEEVTGRSRITGALNGFLSGGK